MTTEALTRVDPSQFSAHQPAIAALDAGVRAVDGHEALGDAVWRDLARAGPDSIGFLVENRAYVHVARDDTDGDRPAWTASLVRLPDARDRTVTGALLEAAVRHVAGRGGGILTCWIFGATDAEDAVFTDSGFGSARSLFEMRAPLPSTETPRWPTGVEVRAFEPGRDETEWLRVNNLAFADHPDQGGWHETTLRARMAEPWFDPSLFLLAFDAGGLAGFNWLKQHASAGSEPARGEIYVIGVDPRTQGTGLGRALAIAGLHAAYERGSAVAMLFCAADNKGALSLYRSLGFTVRRTDRAYTCEVSPMP